MIGTKKILAAKILLLVSLKGHATGIPVVDVANVSQTTISAIENVAQTITQVEQYVSQLAQLEDQLRNTAAPNAYLWDQAEQTIARVLSTIDTLGYYKQQAGSIDAYLAGYGDVNYYRSSQCFGVNGCSSDQYQAMRQSEIDGSDAQMRANGNMLRGLDEQQKQLQQDASNLVRLQHSTQSAQGRMEALQFANQLASNQANQLLQIRTLLVAQQAAEIPRAQTIAAREAKEQAASEQLRRGSYRPSPTQSW
ncbi:P-type conjugative transfer protein TrbJ [Pseudomonas cavernicola]|uniref:P-type conjugative transfer protein TrbJ n=1 Tax=Pseudomonas cavernicola TaxID=2320866 RepID=A0A418XIN2_9PSED|nr:P-type conjugative transfer protein TrbJ [Pseudomonas cavernicola]RJG12297.1 P-type conjugative transfer protein TrbJ [Pseudomonas cavernicola]